VTESWSSWIGGLILRAEVSRSGGEVREGLYSAQGPG
jgi:hypothetical protein